MHKTHPRILERINQNFDSRRSRLSTRVDELSERSLKLATALEQLYQASGIDVFLAFRDVQLEIVKGLQQLDNLDEANAEVLVRHARASMIANKAVNRICELLLDYPKAFFIPESEAATCKSATNRKFDPTRPRLHLS